MGRRRQELTWTRAVWLRVVLSTAALAAALAFGAHVDLSTGARWGLLPLSFALVAIIEVLRTRPRSGLGLLLAFHLLSAQLVLYDVVWCGRGLSSSPFLNLPENDPGRAAVGLDSFHDPWAASFLETPARQLAGERLRRLELPQWNPHEACGASFLGSGELAAASPMELPARLIDHPAALDLWIVLRLALGALGLSLLARRLRLSSLASALAGLPLAYGGALMLHANLVHLSAAVLVPWIWLGFESHLRRGDRNSLLLIAVATALAAASGNPQPLIVAALPMSLRALCLLKGREGRPRIAKKIVLILIAGLSGLLLAAPWLAPQFATLAQSTARVDLLGASTTPTLRSLVAWIAPSSLSSARPDGSGIPAWWYVGASVAAMALLGSMGSTGRQGVNRHWAWSLLLLLALFYISPLARLVADHLPLLRDVGWEKYVSPTQALMGLCAAFGFQRLMHAEVPRKGLGIALGAFVLLILGLTLVDSDHSAPRSIGTVLLALLFALGLFRPTRPLLSSLVPLLMIAELALLRPEAPPRSTWPATSQAAFVDEHARRSEAAENPWRSLALGDLVPPLSSGTLGWQDLRSTSPNTSSDYARWIGPYMNCGGWLRHLMLGASRELLLSPCADLAGMRWFVFADHKVLSGNLRKNLEDLPQIRFGALHRALVFDGASSQGLSSMDPSRASFRLARGASLDCHFKPLAKTLTLEFRLESASSALDLRIGDQERRIEAGARETLVIEAGTETLPFSFRLDGNDDATLFIERYEVERCAPKTLRDFTFQNAFVDREAGVTLIENRSALPIARLSRQVQIFGAPDELWEHWEHFVATGEGFDWRNEFLITTRGDEAFPIFPPSPSTAIKQDMKQFGYEGPERFVCEVDIEAATWLQVAICNDGGWRAFRESDGERYELAVYQANGPFMAVALTGSGDQRIVFEYRAPGLTRGLWLGLVGLALLFGLPRARRNLL